MSVEHRPVGLDTNRDQLFIVFIWLRMRPYYLFFLNARRLPEAPFTHVFQHCANHVMLRWCGENLRKFHSKCTCRFFLGSQTLLEFLERRACVRQYVFKAWTHYGTKKIKIRQEQENMTLWPLELGFDISCNSRSM